MGTRCRLSPVLQFVANYLSSTLCPSRCSIFHVSALGTAGDPVKLNRDREDQAERASVEKIFDYQNKFLPALILSSRSLGPRPDPNVYLLIGAQKTLADVEKKSVLIYISVTTQRALKDLSAVEVCFWYLYIRGSFFLCKQVFY